jgi:hypothetical protein
MSTLNAITSGAGGVSLSGDTSGNLTIQSAGTNVATISSTGLTMNSGNIVQASTAAPAFSAYASSGTAISGGVATKITQDTEEFDTNNNFASSRFTPTVAGYYVINCGCNVPASNYGTAEIFKNGSVYKRGNNGGGAINSSYVSSIVYLNGSTDYVEFYFTDGSSVTTGNGQPNSYFNGCFVRSA